MEPRPFGALPILALGADVAAAPIGEEERERGGISTRQSVTTGPLSSRCSRFSSQDLLAFNRLFIVFMDKEKEEETVRNYARILRKRSRSISSVNDVSQRVKRELEISPAASVTMSVEDSNKPEISVNQNSNIAVTWSSRLWQTNKQDQGVGISSLPLPPLDWADTVDVWEAMRKYETLPEYERDAMMFERHPNLQPRMRAILVDWLNEVCEVYKLHRETLYLAIDYVDRYLTKVTDVQKSRLQLVGVTALFVASKTEEIYPPKLSEFSFITDGACSEQEILKQELIILQVLQWKMTPVTPISWINVLLQTISVDSAEEKEQFLYPQYNGDVFVQIARVIDLCIMNEGSLRFSYLVIATSALAHLTSELVALRASGLRSLDIMPCLLWMSHFFVILKKEAPVEVRLFEKISPDDAHNIQTHVVNMDLLELAQTRLKEKSCSTPEQSQVALEMTPPQSSKSKGKIFVYEGTRNKDVASRSALSTISQKELSSSCERNLC